MDGREVLRQYADAVARISEIDEDMMRLKDECGVMVHDTVNGSNPDFPFNAQRFTVQGEAVLSARNGAAATKMSQLKESRREAQEICERAEEILSLATLRLERIIRLRYEKRMDWNEVADVMARGATADSLRMELARFLDSIEKK